LLSTFIQAVNKYSTLSLKVELNYHGTN